MMYESPIKLNEIGTHISERITKAKDEYIFAQVNMAVDVDKEELIKALSYDRNQYQKGYADGCADAKAERKIGRWVRCDTDGFRNMCKCSECGARIDIQEEFRSFFCYHCGADMREGEQNDS